MIHPSPQIVQCPECRSRNFAIDEACSSCGKLLAVTIGPRPRVRHLNLQTIMLLIAVIAVCLAPVRVAPGWSIVLAIVLFPATVRGILIIAERRADGRPMDAGAKFEAVFASLLITLLILGASVAAFFSTCVPIGMIALQVTRSGEAGFLVAVICGLIAALYVMIALSRRYWPRKD